VKKFIVRLADHSDLHYAQEISDQYERSAKKRGTGIAKRSPDYVKKQMLAGKAIIALEAKTKRVAGFCYIESFGEKQYVANSGLTVFPRFRNRGLAKKIKAKAFDLSKTKYPKAKIFGLTTSLAVMKINSDIGYQPVTFRELTQDDVFWEGCKSCVNYSILESKNRENCLCTGMLYNPNKKKQKKWRFKEKAKVYERLIRLKIRAFTKKNLKSVTNLFIA
jgi:hypothetical protein